MVRIAALNGRTNGHLQNSKENDTDKDRKLRYTIFLVALVILLFRREGSTLRSFQEATTSGTVTTTSSRTTWRPVYTTNVNQETATTVNRFAEDGGNETALPDLDNVVAESKRQNGMEMRFSNETFVMEWRADQAAKRAKQPIRNIDWSQVDCVDSTEKWQKCDLSDDRWGVSVVFISFGRSGSSITWETMSNLASERGQPAREDIGGSSTSATKELDAIKPKEHGKCWLERILCRHQYNNRVSIQSGEGKAEIIGTKWKPFLRAFNHTKSREALEWLAGNPYIKVIYNERNFLDVAISRYKHLNTNASALGAHCYGKDCVDYHKLTLANTSVPVRYLKDTLRLLEKQANGIASIMEELKLPHLKVVYEKLYYARRADQWMDLFRFVGVGPMSGLEMEHVRAHMTQYSTHADDRGDAIANYEQIRKALRSTEYNKYLRQVVRKSKIENDRGEVVLD